MVMAVFSSSIFRRFIIVIIIVAVILLPLITYNEFYLNVAILILISCISAMSLNLILRVGYLSLAQAGFMGIGAYTSALLSVNLKVPFIFAFFAAGIVASLFAYVFGRVLLRMKSVYFVLITFAFGEVIRLVFTNWDSLFGGVNGITGIQSPQILGMQFKTMISYYYLTLLVAVLSITFMMRMCVTHTGRGFNAINESEKLAESTGIDVMKQSLFAFSVGNFFTGISGSIYAHYVHFISPSAFTFWDSVNLIIINVLGGATTLWGPIIGAFILVPLPEIFRGAMEYQRILYGLTLILVIIFLPSGIAGKLRDVISKHLLRKQKEVRDDGCAIEG